VNREELNWLLQTINDAETATRFLLAQYERGRISLEAIADVMRERGWIDRKVNQFFTTSVFTTGACALTQYGSTELPIAYA
jgi:hypothetical protein